MSIQSKDVRDTIIKMAGRMKQQVYECKTHGVFVNPNQPTNKTCPFCKITGIEVKS